LTVYICTATETSSASSSVAGGGGAGGAAGGGGPDAAAMYNGAGRAYTRDVRNTDTVAAAAAAASARARASSSELSESDNEAGFNRSSADYNIPGAVTLVIAEEQCSWLPGLAKLYARPYTSGLDRTCSMATRSSTLGDTALPQ